MQIVCFLLIKTKPLGRIQWIFPRDNTTYIKNLNIDEQFIDEHLL